MIPVVLVYFAGRKFNVPFRKLFWLFGAFIVLCGFTHFLEAFTTWVPIYRFAGLLKVFTAVVSWATVFSLIPVVPQALAMRSPDELEREIQERRKAEATLETRNLELRQTLERLRQAEEQLRAHNEQLEERVRERTQELQLQTYELQQLNAALRRSNEELDDFAHIASHDLKEPLRGIHNYATILKEDYAPLLDQVGTGRLETLSRLALRLEELTNTLLEYSRISRGNFGPQPLDLHELLGRVLETLSITLEQRRVRVVMPPERVEVVGDRLRLGKVFFNLISNAIKYNVSKEPEVEIGARQELTETVFWVKDNGIGIPEKHFSTIFRMFKRLHTRDEYGGGVGAGLSIVKKIVERHGGRIWLEPNPGCAGTTFYFTIPRELPT